MATNDDENDGGDGAVRVLDSYVVDVGRVYNVCLLSSFVTTFVGVSGVASWEATGSALMLGLGMINLVETARSLLLLWRFSAPVGSDRREDEEDAAVRDERAGRVVAAAALLTGAAALVVSLVDFDVGREPVNVPYLMSVAAPSTVLFAFLGRFKTSYAPRIRSDALMLDGLSSWLLAAFSATLAVNTLIIDAAPGAWWLDPAASSVLSIATVATSADVLRTDARMAGLSLCSAEFWRGGGRRRRPRAPRAHTDMTTTTGRGDRETEDEDEENEENVEFSSIEMFTLS